MEDKGKLLKDSEKLKIVFDNAITFSKEMMNENDRVVVIISTANIDSILMKILQNSLLAPINRKADELFYGDAVLSSFNSKIILAYRLAIIDKDVYILLNMLRKIRNEFAHKVQNCNLDSPPYIDRVAEIVRVFNNTNIIDSLRKYFPGKTNSSRDFRIIMSLVSALFEMKIHYLPKAIKANPIKLSWLPEQVDIT